MTREKTLGELYWETFEQHLADEQRTMLGPWEDVPQWQRPSIEFAAQAIRAEVIEECAKVADFGVNWEPKENFSEGALRLSHETACVLAKAIRRLKEQP